MHSACARCSNKSAQSPGIVSFELRHQNALAEPGVRIHTQPPMARSGIIAAAC
jgi:hypothetical protein